jgi:hypothetical protein
MNRFGNYGFHALYFNIIAIQSDWGKCLINGRDVLKLNARGGQARLAQARQDRPGFGELDLTELFVKT